LLLEKKDVNLAMIKEFKKPDLTAPRCRPGAHKIVNASFLKEFKEKHPQYKDLTNHEINLILSTFHGKLWDHTLLNRDGIELLEGLGYIFIGTCFSAKKFNIDVANSIKNKFKTRHNNFESDNYLAKIFYTNFSTKYRFKNREMWTFKATRDFKRSVAKVYPVNWKLYVQVESGKNIANYMKRARKNDYFRKIGETFIADSSYNEFDLN
jgi:hypothetical protein